MCFRAHINDRGPGITHSFYCRLWKNMHTYKHDYINNNVYLYSYTPRHTCRIMWDSCIVTQMCILYANVLNNINTDRHMRIFKHGNIHGNKGKS